MSSSFYRSLVAALLVFGVIVTAQAVMPSPFTRGASFSVRLAGSGSATMTVYAESTVAVSHNTFSGVAESAIDDANFRPGQSYSVNLAGSGASAYDLSFIAPDGYSVYVDGKPTNIVSKSSLGSSYSDNYSVQLLPVSSNEYLAAGEFTGISIGKAIAWEAGLGGLRSTRGAGRVFFRELDLVTNAPASRSRLFYTPPVNLGEVTVVMDGPSNQRLRQIGAPQTVVDFVDDVTNGYWIKYYAVSQATWSGSIYTFSGSPWRTIRVESPGTSQLKITETEGSVSRVSAISLASGSIASGAYVWELQESDGATVLRTTTHTSTVPGSGQRDDVVAVRTGGPSGTVVAKTKYHYVAQTWGEEEVTEVVADPDTAALTTKYEYWTSSTAYGNYRRVKSVTDPTDNWTATQYYDDWNRRGQTKYEFHPYLDSPATVSLNTAFGRVVTFDYVADWTTRYRIISSRIETVNGTQTAKMVGARALNQSLSYQLYTVYQADHSPDASNLRRSYFDTIDIGNGYNNPDHYGVVVRRMAFDDAQTSGQRQVGTYNSSTKQFTPGSGSDVLDTEVNGTAFSAVGTMFDHWRSLDLATIYLLPYQSTVVETMRDSAGKPLHIQTLIYTGGTSFATMTADDFTYDTAGRLLTQSRDSNTLLTNTYTNGRLTSTVDVAGTETQFTYDGLRRVGTSVKKGAAASGSYAAQGDITTTYTYDGANHVTQTVMSGSSLSLTSSDAYDLAGRQTSTTAPGSYTTGYGYTGGGKIVTATLPGGSTKIGETYVDGQTKSQTGTAVVAQYFGYSVDSGTGNITRQVNAGGSTSTALVKTTSNWVGQPISEVRPGWNGADVTRTWTYSNYRGLLTKLTQPGLADTLYEYDWMGVLTRQGLDLNANGTLDLSGSDRVTDHGYAYFLYGTAWGRRDTTSVYAQAGSSTTTKTEEVQTILNNGAGRLSGVISYDVFGNGTTKVVDVTPGSKTLTITTYNPTFTAYTQQVAYNGLAMSAKDPAGNTTTFGYDALGRPLTSTDPRTGTSTTAYVAGTSQVYTVTDAASVVQATYAYDSAGRVSSVKDALNKYAYTSYTDRNEVYRTWGDTAIPVEYGYDSWGHQTTMKTYRAGTGWTGSTWPASPGTADTTTWAFHEPTALLSSKTDAAGKAVSYTYKQTGQIATREWARILTGTTHVKTTYDYSTTTGELTSVDYNDATPDLTYTYNRLGSMATVTDVTGTRTFNYNLAGTLELQNEDLPSYFNSKRLTYPIATSGIIGRPTGLQLGTSGSPTADQSVTYGYDTYGRFNSLAGGGTTLAYTYTSNSNLLASIADSASGWSQARTYLSNRDLLDIIETKVSTTSKAKFDYAYDNLGRRTAVAKTGTLYTRYGNGTQGLDTTFGYDDRSQVTSEQTKLGGAATVLTGRDDVYAWDNFGNRSSTNGTTHNGNTANYTTNALNQYTQRTVPGIFDVAGAAGSSTTVTVNGSSTGVTRHGEYFFKGQALTNTSTAAYTTLAVSDGTTTTNLPAFVARTPEAFVHDDDGNLTSDGRWDYTYDAENRLSAMQTHTALTPSPLPNTEARRLEFKQDYLGRRVEKLVRSGWSGTSFATVLSDEKFVYDGWNPIAKLNALSSNALVASHYWGLDWSGTLQGAGGVGGLALTVEAGSTHLPIFDGNGNVMGLITGSTGAIDAAYEYDAFGNTLREGGSYAASNPFRFSTKYTDLETGLVYYGLRYYSPSMGRFINKDPIEESGGLNLYGFCGNNGVNRWDNLGMDWDDAEDRLKAYNELMAQYEHMRYYVDAVYGHESNWGWEGYGSSVAFDPGLAMRLSGDYEAGVSLDHGRLIAETLARADYYASAVYTANHPNSQAVDNTVVVQNTAAGRTLRITMPGATQEQMDVANAAAASTIAAYFMGTDFSGPNSIAGSNPAWDAQFAKDTQPNRLLASNGTGYNGAVFGPGGVYVKPAPSPVIPQGPLNGSGNGVVVEGIAGYYVLVGGGGGSSTVRLENGTVATYAVGQIGIGLGGKGAGIQGGKVWGVFQPSDYGGPFLNISANFGVGVSLSVWPNGSAGITFGPAPGAGISASLQWYEPTSVFPAPQQPPPQTSSPSNKGPN